MIRFQGNLPQGALVSAPSLAQVIGDAGGIWLCFDPEFLTLNSAQITAVTPRVGRLELRPTDAADGAATLVNWNGADVMATQARANCGFRGTLSAPFLGICAIFGAGAEPAKTVMACDTAGGSVVLSSNPDNLALAERKGTATATCPPVSTETPQVLFATLTDRALTLATRDETSLTHHDGCFTGGDITLWIGCRRDGTGLYRTLGELRLADLILFPGHDICADRSLRTMLTSYAAAIFDEL